MTGGEFVLGRVKSVCMLVALCCGVLAGCSAGEGGNPAEVKAETGHEARRDQDSNAFQTPLPPRMGLSLRDIQNAQQSLPYCELYTEYLTPYVLQAYYSNQGFDGCVVAWIGDTGNSLEVNSSYAEDVYRIYVKRSSPAVQDTVFRMLGNGVGPVDLRFGTPRDNAVDTFTLALDANGFPIVAWLKQTSVHFPNVALRAARWDGQAWVNMGDVLNDVNSPYSVASKPHLSWNPNGQPVLEWVETVDGTSRNITRTWNGTAWE